MGIPLIKEGEPIIPGREPYLAPGVRGYAVKSKGAIYIPVIVADKPGNGDVRRFLDSLPTDQTIRFPCVISPVLAAALERRGFVATKEEDKRTGQWVPVYERRRCRRAR